MTVIAFDGKTLAADRRCCRGDTVYSVNKLFRVGKAVVGLAGGSDYALQWVEWFKNGEKVEDFPKIEDTENWLCALVVSEGRILFYDRTPYPLEVFDKFTAVGSGREVALGAMHMGAIAYDAVAAASRWISSCGNGIDTLEIE